VTISAGRPIPEAIAHRTSGSGYFFGSVSRSAATSRLIVSAHGGRRAGQLFVGTLSAVVEHPTHGSFAYLNPVSTLIARYVQTHPSQSTARATRMVYRFLKLPADVPLSTYQTRTALFDGAVFLAAAQKSGGFDAYVSSLVKQLSDPAARHPFRGAPRNDPDLLTSVGTSIAGAIAGRIFQSLESTACAGAGQLESFLSDLGQCPSQNQDAQIQTQLDGMKTQIAQLSSQVTSLKQDLTTLNWDLIFGASALLDIENSITAAHGELQAMKDDATAIGDAAAAACPPLAQLASGSGYCYDLRQNQSDFNTIAARFKSTDLNAIYNGLTGAGGGGFSATFLGATQAQMGGSLQPGQYSLPILSATQNAALIAVRDHFIGLQALQFDVIITYQKTLRAGEGQVCPTMTLGLPESPANECDWSQLWEYELAQEDLPQYTVQALPPDLLVDMRNGYLWNAYPQQICDTIFGTACPAGQDLPNPDPQYAVSPITDPKALAACLSDQNLSDTSPIDIPAYQWTALPGSCLHDYEANTDQAWQGCDVSDCGLQLVVIGPDIPNSAPVGFGGFGQSWFGEQYIPVPAPATPWVFWASQTEELNLLNGWTGSPAAWLTGQGFQNLSAANSGPWSALTSPGLGWMIDMGSSYSPYCAAIIDDPNFSLLGAVSGPVEPSANCFDQGNFELQVGYPPSGMQFNVISQDFPLPPPAPTSLPRATPPGTTPSGS
jgi:hypothetical protein